MKHKKYPHPSEFNFFLNFRVRSHYCDAHGIMHHSNFLRFMEDTRVEYARSHGLDYRKFSEEGQFLVVSECAIKYIGVAKFDDEVIVYARVIDHNRISFKMEYIITPKDSDSLILYGYTTLVCVDTETRRPVRFPEYALSLIADSHEKV
ncbi:MAG: acyl-CoA thioesterase [candidate division Zixibacteria bacterium]|nr:acyl-CoA thioesterase [candidate division Zixibacteria bacterium]